jgi:hypothetical protein
MARRLSEHMLREGVKANDEVLLVPAGAWVAARGPLRPGLDALAAHLRDAGAGVKIAKALCVAALIAQVLPLNMNSHARRSRVSGSTRRGSTPAVHSRPG